MSDILRLIKRLVVLKYYINKASKCRHLEGDLHYTFQIGNVVVNKNYMYNTKSPYTSDRLTILKSELSRKGIYHKFYTPTGVRSLSLREISSNTELYTNTVKVLRMILDMKSNCTRHFKLKRYYVPYL